MNKHKRLLSFVLALVMVVGMIPLTTFAEGEVSETVTVTVNYVYERNGAMVTQPWSAKIPAGQFTRDVAVPAILNYSVDTVKSTGLGEGITYTAGANGDPGNLRFDLNVTSDITVTLYYVAGQVDFKVNHYQQKVDSDEYQLMETVTGTGDVDAYAEVAVIDYPGSYCVGKPEVIISSQETTVIDIYYNRYYYTVDFDLDGGINGPAPIYAKYGTPFDLSSFSSPTRAGYSFGGWYNGDERVYTGEVTGNITYKAKWIPNEEAPYKFVIWEQNANDNEYSYKTTIPSVVDAPVGSTIYYGQTKCGYEQHIHSAGSCYDLTCGLKEHKHDSSCACTIEEHTHTDGCDLTCIEHTHDTDCKYIKTITCNGNDYTPSFYYETSLETETLNYLNDSNLSDGQHDDYFVSDDGTTVKSEKFVSTNNGSFLKKLDGTWYRIYLPVAVYHDADIQNGDVVIDNCKEVSHTHGDGACTYDCGKTAHTHNSDCCAKGIPAHVHTGQCYSTLPTCGKTEHIHGNSCFTETYDFGDEWVLRETVSGKVEPDGSTIINVYLDRRTYTLNFEYCTTENSTTYDGRDSITARWGEDIRDQYDWIVSKVANNSTRWCKDKYSTSGPWTNYFGIMPVGGGYYVNQGQIKDPGTMYYYGEDLNGEYKLIFQVDYVGGTGVTEHDYFEFEGYTCNKEKSAELYEDADGAEFFYDRNSHDLVYFSGGEEVNKEQVKYQAGLGSYANYKPTKIPANVEKDAVFAGWYKDPEGTVPFDFDSTTMPNNKLPVYAKWVNRSYTVTTYQDSNMESEYTYEGYTGSQTVEKYSTCAVEPVNPPATADGVFTGWYYLDSEGKEQRFSFEMDITQNYDLYPKYTELYPLDYTVEYVYTDENGTVTHVAETVTRTNMFGTQVTELAKTGSELTGISEADRNLYFPDATSKTITLDEENMKITFNYAKPGTVEYIVKYVDVDGNPIIEDANGNEIENPVEKTTQLAIVTETYLPIDGYTPRQYQITQELVANPDFDNGDNTIIFVYGGANGNLKITKNGVTDVGAPFVFSITGEGVSMEVVIYGNGSAMIVDLPAGEYTVKEVTGYWRYSLAASQTVTVSGSADAEVTFTNTRSNNSWLDDFASATNIFGSSGT